MDYKIPQNAKIIAIDDNYTITDLEDDEEVLSRV